MNNPITRTDYLRASCRLLEHGWLCVHPPLQLERWRKIVREYELANPKEFLR